MAHDTPVECRNMVIYEVYVRAHSREGTFHAVEKDFRRIRDLGVDVIWLMPIYPIGVDGRKGTLGSPYAISDYRSVNPEMGTLEDLASLIRRAHDLGLKVMLDIVFNHTSPDSILAKQHPEWFYQDDQGKPVNTVPEWCDIVDIRHPNPDLSAYLIETLVQWAQFGVDGFRCDVAPFLPIKFWEMARSEVNKVKPGVIWLAESIHISFLKKRRSAGLRAHADAELYTAFDLTYDYDLHAAWRKAIRDGELLTDYLNLFVYQQGALPENAVKLRFVENHDNERIQSLAASPDQALAWTAFQSFLPGAFLLYGGIESGASHTPSLFEAEPVEWNGYSYSPFISTLMHLKKHPFRGDGHFTLLSAEPALSAAWDRQGRGHLGIFNLHSKRGEIQVPLEDGLYQDILNNEPVFIESNRVRVPQHAQILAYDRRLDLSPYKSILDS